MNLPLEDPDDLKPLPDPWKRLKASLKRAFFISCALILMAVFFIYYAQYQIAKLREDNNFVYPYGPHPQGLHFSNRLRPGLELLWTSFPATSERFSSNFSLQASPSEPGSSSPPKSPYFPSLSSPGSSDPLLDISPLIDNRSIWAPLLSLLLGAALLGSILAAVYYCRRRSRPKPPFNALMAYAATCERLRSAELLATEGKGGDSAREISAILRTYIAWRFNLGFVEWTTSEISDFLLSHPEHPLHPHRAALGDLFQTCDLLKFAQYETEPEGLRRILQAAAQFVQTTRPEKREDGSDALIQVPHRYHQPSSLPGTAVPGLFPLP